MLGKSSVSIRLMAWSIGLCPLMLAIAFHTGLKSVPLAVETPRLPALSFRQYAIDQRRVNPASTIEAYFAFQNRGTEPVEIVRIQPSCDCLKTHLQGARDNIIEPGGQGRVVVQMQPGNTSPGVHQYTLVVKYNDPEPREIPLLFKVDLPATLWVTPPFLGFYHPKGSEATPAEFTVTDGRGKRFEVTDATINTDLVQIAIGETTRTQQGNFQQKINILVAGELPPKMTQHILKIRTTDPEFPELRVPIRLEGEANKAQDNGELITLDHESNPAESDSEANEPATKGNEN